MVVHECAPLQRLEFHKSKLKALEPVRFVMEWALVVFDCLIQWEVVHSSQA